MYPRSRRLGIVWLLGTMRAISAVAELLLRISYAREVLLYTLFTRLINF